MALPPKVMSCEVKSGNYLVEIDGKVDRCGTRAVDLVGRLVDRNGRSGVIVRYAIVRCWWKPCWDSPKRL